MLGLAASDIAQDSPNDSALTCSAMNHRLRAITALNEALSRGVHTMEEGNAMLATCYSLVFQSALISDGFPEYMSFIRGCIVVAWQMGAKQLKFLFEGMLADAQLATMGPYLHGAPNIDPALTSAAISSLEACAPLIEKDSEKSFYYCCLEIAHASVVSSREGTSSLAFLKSSLFTCLSIFGYYEDLRHLLLLHVSP